MAHERRVEENVRTERHLPNGIAGQNRDSIPHNLDSHT